MKSKKRHTKLYDLFCFLIILLSVTDARVNICYEYEQARESEDMIARGGGHACCTVSTLTLSLLVTQGIIKLLS